MTAPSLRNPLQLDTSCTRCATLVKSRRQVVHGYGASDAEILFVGRSPGPGGSDETGVPFTGDDAGRRFLWVLERVGLCEAGDRSSVEPRLGCYVVNAVRCATPRNRRPRLCELRNCATWLAEELLRVDPAVIVPVGSTAGRAVYDILAAEPFPGARAAHGTTLTRFGYRVHPFAHLLRLRNDEMRNIASRLIRVAVHARASAGDAQGALDRKCAARTLFRASLASRIAGARALERVGLRTGRDYWVRRMEGFARLALAMFRHVSLEKGARPGFRYLGEHRGEVHLQPLDLGEKGPRDLHEALRLVPTPQGVFEYWLFHRYLWNVAETRRHELIYREGRLQRLLAAAGESPTRKVADRKLVFPPRVTLADGFADLTILARDCSASDLTLRLATVRIGLESGRLRYIDREETRVPGPARHRPPA